MTPTTLAQIARNSRSSFTEKTDMKTLSALADFAAVIIGALFFALLFIVL
jgi:hypothetical protein